MNNSLNRARLFCTLLFILTFTVGKSQSLSLDEILKLIDGTPSEITTSLSTKGWKFESADKDMSDDGTLLMESTMIFYFKDNYGNYLASFGHMKTFNFDTEFSYDPRKKRQAPKIGYYLNVSYKFADIKIFNALNNQLINKGITVQNDEVLEGGIIEKSFNHDEFNIVFYIAPSESGQTFQFVIGSKYLVEK